MSDTRKPDIVVGIDIGQTCSVCFPMTLRPLSCSLTEDRRVSHIPSDQTGAIHVPSIDGPASMESRKQTKSPPASAITRERKI
jgi:hypothetical protein